MFIGERIVGVFQVLGIEVQFLFLKVVVFFLESIVMYDIIVVEKCFGIGVVGNRISL